VKKILIAVMISAAILSGAGAAMAKTETQISGREALKELKENLSTVKSYTADFKMSVRMGQKKSNITGKIECVLPHKARIEMSLREKKTLTQLTVSDARALWQYVPDNDVVYLFDLRKMTFEQKQAYIAQGDLTRPFRDMDKATISFKGLARIRGEETFLYEGKPSLLIRVQDKESFDNMKVWVARQDGLVRRVVIYDTKGKETIVQDYENIQTNVEIEEGRFSFTPPQGVLVVTPQAIRQQ